MEISNIGFLIQFFHIKFHNYILFILTTSVADPDPWNPFISLDPDKNKKMAGSGSN